MPDSSDEEITSGPAMPSGNEAVRAGGYKPMKPQPGAEKYAPSEALKKKKLPPKVDLRPFMTRVEDQGQTMSCVANAVAGAYEYGVKRVTGQSEDISRLFVYYNARWRANDQAEDGGCYVQNAIEGLQRFGSCPEKNWPFKKPLILKKPNRSSYQEATKGKVSQMKQVPTELQAWKQALADGFPIVFGCLLFDSFDACCEQGGVVTMPSPEDVERATHGGHSMLCVGYSDVEEVFIVRNSWGDAWGDSGYCYMPYNYLMNPKFNSGDSWVFTPPVERDDTHRPKPNPNRPKPHPQPQPHNRKVRPAPPLPSVMDYILPLLEDFWFYDDTPVVNGGMGVDFVIETYEISLYESIEINYFEEYTVEWSSVVEEEYAEYSEYVTEERFESMEEYTIQEVAQEYTRETGETNFSVGSAIATIGGVVAAGVVAASVLNHGKDDSAEEGEEDEEVDDTALVEAADAEDEGTEEDGEGDDAEDAELVEAADAEDDSTDEEEGDDSEEGDDEADDAEVVEAADAEDDSTDEEESEDEESDEEDDSEEEDDDEGDDDSEEAGDDEEEGDDEKAGDEEEEGDDEEEDDDEEGDDEEEEGDDEEEDDDEEDEEDEEEGGDDEEEGGDDEEEGGDDEEEK